MIWFAAYTVAKVQCSCRSLDWWATQPTQSKLRTVKWESFIAVGVKLGIASCRDPHAEVLRRRIILWMNWCEVVAPVRSVLRMDAFTYGSFIGRDRRSCIRRPGLGCVATWEDCVSNNRRCRLRRTCNDSGFTLLTSCVCFNYVAESYYGTFLGTTLPAYRWSRASENVS